MKNEYLKTKKYMILILLLIGSLNCGTTVLGYNFIEKTNILLNNNFNTKYPIDKIIYLLVALAGILLVINRDLWLLCIEDFTTPLSKISLPGIPTNVRATSISGRHSFSKVVSITWNPPENINDFKIRRYIVSCYHSSNGALKEMMWTYPDIQRVIFSGLSIHAVYYFEVQVETTSFIKSLPSPRIYK
jgi:uncharacterized membrane protein YuzA (DUF378 family)